MTSPCLHTGEPHPYAFLPLILTKQNGGLLFINIKGIVLG